MAKKVIEINGVKVEFRTLSSTSVHAAKKRISQKMLEVNRRYRSKSAKSRQRLSSIVFNV